MHPAAVGLQTFFASPGARGDLTNRVQVRAGFAHAALPSGNARAQILMNGLHDDGSFPDARGDALDRAGANVADREDAGSARDEGRAERPPLLILPGSDESFAIEPQASSEPLRVGLGTDHDE